MTEDTILNQIGKTFVIDFHGQKVAFERDGDRWMPMRGGQFRWKETGGEVIPVLCGDWSQAVEDRGLMHLILDDWSNDDPENQDYAYHEKINVRTGKQAITAFADMLYLSNDIEYVVTNGTYVITYTVMAADEEDAIADLNDALNLWSMEGEPLPKALKVERTE